MYRIFYSFLILRNIQMATLSKAIQRANQNHSNTLSAWILPYSTEILLRTRSMWTLSNHQQKAVVPQPETTYSHLIDKAKENHALVQREQFAEALKGYMSLEKYRRGHMKFIREGLLRMEEFNLQKDLLSYNRLLDIFPKGRFKNKTFFDAIWPKPHPQIDLALDVLQKMEDNGIRPDYITYSVLCEVFGRVSLPVQKCTRIAVWFDKYENVDPYRIKGEMPTDPFVLSQMALERMAGKDCRVQNIKVPHSEEKEDSFVISASSKKQTKLLEGLEFNDTTLLHVEGPHLLWLQKVPLFYYSLRHLLPNDANVIDDDNMPEFDADGAILGVCLCQPATQESLTLWTESLQNQYPQLKSATIVYDVTVLDDMYSNIRILNEPIATLVEQLKS